MEIPQVSQTSPDDARDTEQVVTDLTVKMDVLKQSKPKAIIRLTSDELHYLRNLLHHRTDETAETIKQQLS